MAVEAEPRRTTPPERRQDRRPRQNFETWSWFFMRISGLVLIFLALLHFAITHILNDVADTNAAFVNQRWDNPLWRVFDWALLALGLLHGLNGLRWIIDDYVRRPAKRAVVKATLYSITGALFAYGTFTILTYKVT
ncbi:MAG: succinate dehydrogenase / fumarate reductase, rane anchor subunit [Actinomycetota bacterium]|jgi:succinate dehydrogenase / fumarate reductase membrane anchor subunit